MASDARLSVGLPGHPKTKKLVRRGGTEAAWHLVCLFLWSAANRSDGDLAGLSDEDIELAADWPGEEGAFVTMLADVGFLDGEQGAYKIHDWAEHNPWAAGANDRSESSKWAALCKRYGRDGAAKRMPEYAERMRQDSEPDAGECDPHATGTNPQCGSDAPIPSPSPSPSPSPLPIPFPSPNPSPTQEPVCVEPPSASPPAVVEPMVIGMPLNDRTEFPVTQSMIDRWQELYPAIDVMQCLRNMVGWCDAKPTNRKTLKGVKAFITNWLAREQNKAPSGGAYATNQPIPFNRAAAARKPILDHEDTSWIEGLADPNRL